MKNKKFMIGLSFLSVLTLAACRNKAAEVTAIEGEFVEETSAGELLIDSLEYLLSEEETAAETEEEEGQTDSTEEQQRIEDDGAKEEQAEDLQTETEEAQDRVEVTIYYGNGASDELNAETEAMEEITAENLIDALLKHNIVSLGTKVNSFEEQKIDGVKTLYLDLSKQFRDYLKTMSQAGEIIIMSSVASTFLEAYDAEGIVITVDGAALETGNAAYEEAIPNTHGQLIPTDTE